MKIFVSLILLQLACECNGATFVKFHITQGKPNIEGIRCILKSLRTSYGAFVIRDEKEDCTMLTMDWAVNKTYSPGYTYLEKKVSPVFQSFVLPDQIGEQNVFDNRERLWDIPGVFGVGGRLDVSFSTLRTDWTGISFRFFDQPIGSPFRIDEDFGGLVFISIAMSRVKNEVRFKTYSDRWRQQSLWSPFPNQDTYKLTIAAQQTDFQILFDGMERARIPYVGPPWSMKSMGVQISARIIDMHINNVTFNGVLAG